MQSTPSYKVASYCYREICMAAALGENFMTNIVLSFALCTQLSLQAVAIFHTNWQQCFKIIAIYIYIYIAIYIYIYI